MAKVTPAASSVTLPAVTLTVVLSMTSVTCAVAVAPATLVASKLPPVIAVTVAVTATGSAKTSAPWVLTVNEPWPVASSATVRVPSSPATCTVAVADVPACGAFDRATLKVSTPPLFSVTSAAVILARVTSPSSTTPALRLAPAKLRLGMLPLTTGSTPVTTAATVVAPCT